jgi:DNA-binding SARP family transcriptional activator
MGESDRRATVELTLLGGFAVQLDGLPISAGEWTRPQAATLVKVLALAPGRTLHREQLIDRLWPELAMSEAAPRLHKLAHYARKALAHSSAIVLRDDMVTLLPDADVLIDVDLFERASEEAMAAGTSAAASAAADLYGGELLPGDRYEPWCEHRREELRLRYRELLRGAGRWEELLADDPTDEDAHVALMTGYVEAGEPRLALRQFERMDGALRSELGVGPGPQAVAIHDRVLAATLPEQAKDGRLNLVGRRNECEQLERLVVDAGHGGGRTVFIGGAPGVGKSALLDWMGDRVDRFGWRVGRGVAAAVEGAWPYAPVLDALADLCRRYPAVIDDLDATYRAEIERALTGNELTWTGEGTHQRLFVAAAELLRLAASGRGLLILLDDMHEADEASLRMLHYLCRGTARERVIVIVAYRGGDRRVDQVKNSLLRRNLAFDLPLHPLDRAATAELIRAAGDDAADPSVDKIWEVTGGLPFAVIEMAAAAPEDAPRAGATGLSRLSVRTQEMLQRAAVIGMAFDTDQFVALADVPEAEAYAALDAALAALIVVHTGSGYRFRHALIREVLLGDVPPGRQRAFHQKAADRLIALRAPAAQIAHHLIAAGRLSDAAPHVVRAVEREAAVGAYRDALALVDAVKNHAGPADHRRLMAMRANLLSALGDRGTIDAYRAALAVAEESEQRLLRARMAQAAVMEGDLETAREVLEGVEPDGGQEDVAILLARGNLAYFTGDVDGAWRAADQVGGQVRPHEDTWQRLDLLTLQALIAHHRGELFTRLRTELRRAQDTPELASTLFDPYMCVVEYLLYGTTPYGEVRAMAEALRETARRTGVLRAEAFATALVGEAALLAGDLGDAERELLDSIDLHREAGAPAGEANALQRLAEIRVLQGNRAEAQRLLRRALQQARWSMLALHLVQRIFGTMILAAESPQEARALVDQASDTMGREDTCAFCVIMFAVPAAVACADVGDVDEAERYLQIAEQSSALWEGTAWQAAVLEARAHLAEARGDAQTSGRLLREAGALFDQSGQPLDARRCRQPLRRSDATASL